MAAPVWVPDSEVKACTICGTSFLYLLFFRNRLRFSIQRLSSPLRIAATTAASAVKSFAPSAGRTSASSLARAKYSFLSFLFLFLPSLIHLLFAVFPEFFSHSMSGSCLRRVLQEARRLDSWQCTFCPFPLHSSFPFLAPPGSLSVLPL